MPPQSCNPIPPPATAHHATTPADGCLPIQTWSREPSDPQCKTDERPFGQGAAECKRCRQAQARGPGRAVAGTARRSAQPKHGLCQGGGRHRSGHWGESQARAQQEMGEVQPPPLPPK